MVCSGLPHGGIGCATLITVPESQSCCILLLLDSAVIVVGECRGLKSPHLCHPNQMLVVQSGYFHVEGLVVLHWLQCQNPDLLHCCCLVVPPSVGGLWVSEEVNSPCPLHFHWKLVVWNGCCHMEGSVVLHWLQYQNSNILHCCCYQCCQVWVDCGWARRLISYVHSIPTRGCIVDWCRWWIDG